ncbi:MAG: hypothetical protein V7647_2465 [Acidobacteriota bacterium]
MAVSEAAMLARIEPFYHWHTPIAWTGYILFVDALVWKRRGTSWLRSSPAELLFLACASVPLWVVFEVYNKYSLRNWYYVGLTDNLPLRYAGYIWAFATISPAIFETADLVSALRDRRAPLDRADPLVPQPLGVAGWLSVAMGAVMLIVPILLRSRPIAAYLAAPVWIGFILLLDPLNARAGAESILGDWRRRRSGRLVNLLASGVICGFLWEFWNYWGGSKWFYNVPILPDVKIFEMPILGFGGFPPFAVECFVMYVAVRRWLWRPASRPVGI